VSGPVFYRWQYCRSGSDISSELFAEQDADTVRVWEGAHGDFCLLEATRSAEDDRWRVTGGDGDVSQAAGASYDDPTDALVDVYYAEDLRLAQCRCGTEGDCD
jgi:hypothetical protein